LLAAEGGGPAPPALLACAPRGSFPAVPENVLYYGDNLDILRRYVADESVDLVYLNPA